LKSALGLILRGASAVIANAPAGASRRGCRRAPDPTRGLLRMSTAEEPGSDIGARSDAEVRAMHQQWLDVMHPPAGWGQTALRLPNGWPRAGEEWRRPHGRRVPTDATEAAIAA
jgi:hypothetical protein